MVAQSGTVQTYRSTTAGVRPGAGSARALLQGETFINLKDGVLCYLDDQGALITSYFLNVAGMATWAATLPTTLPTKSGQPWLNGGVLSFS